MPGQKTNVTVGRKRKRDLQRPNDGISMGTIVPMIHPDGREKFTHISTESIARVSHECFTRDRCASRREIRQVSRGVTATIGIVHYEDNDPFTATTRFAKDNVDKECARFLTSAATCDRREACERSVVCVRCTD